jgi:cholesterol transport system auxiliary component
MNNMAKNFGVGWAAVFLLALAACSIGPTESRAPQTYLLDPEIAFKTSPANPAWSASATLLVSPPRAQAGFDTVRMAYLRRPHEVSYYAFNQWADTPARMLMGLLAQAMERTDLWRAVVQMPSPVRADYRLDSDNLVLEQQFFSTPSRVRLALRAQLIDIKQQRIIGTRDFEVVEDAPSEDAYGGVIAANRATAKLLQQLATWVSTIISANTQKSH